MLSVIIPTILMGPKEVFKYTLNVLNSSEVVSEIIIVDNTDSKSFKTFYTATKKMTVIEPGKNIFVNKAWNLGLRKTTSPFYLILNDDVLVHPQVIERCLNTYKNLSDGGVLTVKTVRNKNIEEYELLIKQTLVEQIQVSNEVPEGRVGWFILGSSKNWEEVPQEIDIFYGDDFIYEISKKKGFSNYIIEKGALISHYESSTVMNTEFLKVKTPIVENDHCQWPKIKERYGF